MSDETKALTVAQSAVMAHRFQPAELREMVKVEAELRNIMIDYYKSAMREGHHYYSIKEGDKPALSKEGGLNLCSLFKVVVGAPELEKIWSDDGHLTVEAKVPLLTPSGDVVAVGAGMCSTCESKYGYRWCWSNQVPDNYDKDSLPSRKRGSSVQYRVPNDDLADCYNTVIKMADKRALVSAACKLPLVSELFTQDLDETIRSAVDERDDQDRQRRGKRQDSGDGKPKQETRQRGASEAQLGVLRKWATDGRLSDEQRQKISAALEQGLSSRQASGLISRVSAALDALRSKPEDGPQLGDEPPPPEPEDAPPPESDQPPLYKEEW